MSVANIQRRAIRPPKAAEKLGIGLSTLWMKVKNEPDFPKPFKQGPRVTTFFDDELDQYLVSCATKARCPQAA